jgi:hypothetical protein
MNGWMDAVYFFAVLLEVRGSRFLRKGWLSPTKLLNAMTQTITTPILTKNYTIKKKHLSQTCDKNNVSKERGRYVLNFVCLQSAKTGIKSNMSFVRSLHPEYENQT